MANDIQFRSVGALPILAIILMILLLIILIPLVFLGIIGAALTRLGFSWLTALAVVLLILLGSAVNLPVYTIRREVVRMEHGAVSMSDPFSAWPREEIWDTVISVSLGGAIIPVCVVLYVVSMAYPLVGTALLLPAAAGVTGVALITFVSTRAVPGFGLQVPLLIPALTALLIGLAFTGTAGLAASVTAMAGGIFGVLTGGNLAHLGKIRDLGIPAFSIGGSGTFGAILFCCILPALIA
jgi:uncharacterized membrane protein